MIPRSIKSTILKALAQYPCVLLVGPRQSGKTTLAKSLGDKYFDLEQETERLRLDLEWPALVSNNTLLSPIILDEAQCFPEVFPRLRGAIDQRRSQNGRFILLGSVAPGIIKEVGESLAGRVAVIELSTFLMEELGNAELDSLWLYGGFPDGGVLNPQAFPDWQKNYITLLTQRDLPQWGLPSKPQMTERLLRMLAALTAQSWNASKVGSNLGINYQTVNSYLDYLEGAFLIRRLSPFATNLKKRLIKSPKLLVRDTGLLHSLLGINDFSQLISSPIVGSSWESFVIEQILSTLQTCGANMIPSYVRINGEEEIDLVLQIAGRSAGIEIKLTSQPTLAMQTKLDRIGKSMQLDYLILLHRGDLVSRSDRFIVAPLVEALAFLKELASQ